MKKTTVILIAVLALAITLLASTYAFAGESVSITSPETLALGETAPVFIFVPNAIITTLTFRFQRFLDADGFTPKPSDFVEETCSIQPLPGSNIHRVDIIPENKGTYSLTLLSPAGAELAKKFIKVI